MVNILHIQWGVWEASVLCRLFAQIINLRCYFPQYGWLLQHDLASRFPQKCHLPTSLCLGCTKLCSCYYVIFVGQGKDWMLSVLIVRTSGLTTGVWEVNAPNFP